MVRDYLLYAKDVRHLSKQTIGQYSGYLEKLNSFCQAKSLQLDQLQESHIRECLGKLRRHGLGVASISNVISIWRVFFKWLVVFEHAKANPVLGIRRPKTPQRLPKALSVADANKLIDFAKAQAQDAYKILDAEGQQCTASHRLNLENVAMLQQRHCVVEILYGAGLRRGELLNLDALPGDENRGWVDLQSSEIHVIGNGARQRCLPLGRLATQALGKWLNLRAA